MRTLASLSVLLLTACAGERQAPTSPLRVPVTAELVVTSSTAGRTSLIARVRRHVAFTSDLDVHLAIPPGARISGPTDWVSIGTPAAGTDERSFEVTFDGYPATDLELTASVQGTGFGLTARASYDFARPTPSPAPALRPEGGPRLVVDGHDLGASVPLGGQAN